MSSVELKSGPISSLYVLKAICAFLVVVIHFPMKYGYYFYPIVRIAVPCFFMISGYFLYNDNRDKMLSNLKRALFKTLKVTIFAYAFYILVSTVISLTVGERVNFGLGLDFVRNCSWITFILAGPQIGAGHLWYLVAYIETLLIIWLFARIGKGVQWLYFIVPIGLIINLLCGRYSFIIPIEDPIIFDVTKEIVARNFLTIGIPAFAIGMWIKQYQNQILKYITPCKSLIISLVLLLVAIIEFAVLIYFFGREVAGDISILTIPFATSIVLACLCYPKFGSNTFVSTIGQKYSSDIYIYHVFVGKFILICTEIVIYTLSGTYFKYMYAAPTVFIATLIFVIVLQRCLAWAKTKISFKKQSATN